MSGERFPRTPMTEEERRYAIEQLTRDVRELFGHLDVLQKAVMSLQQAQLKANDERVNATTKRGARKA